MEAGVPMNWYIIQVHSGFENKIKAQILEKIEQKSMSDLIEEFLIPVEEVVQIRKGKKVTVERKFLLGYVLVKCNLTDEVYHLIKSMSKVTGFLGSNQKPRPVSQGEVDRILEQVETRHDKPKQTIMFEVGEQIVVSDGPFNSFNGTVEDVDEIRSRLRVTISIFGRATPVELEYSQVEKSR